MAGHEVFIGSRSLDRAKGAAASIQKSAGPKSRVVGLVNEEAASRSEIVVVTVPFGALGETLKVVRPSLTPGKILVNVTVPLETSIGGKPSRTIGLWAGSAAEVAAGLVPKGVTVVTAFNNVSAEPLSDLTRHVECDVFVCGDDKEAKRTIMELVSTIPGARAVDAGPLENSRTVEQLTALLVSLNIRYGVRSAGLRVTGLPLT